MKLRSYLLVELALWFTLPLLFLAVYVLRFDRSLYAVLQHLYPVALLATFSLLVKMCLRRLLPGRLLADGLAALWYGSVLVLLASYYLVVGAGLYLWGKVISEELIVSYLAQASDLCDTVAISFPAVVAGALLVWLLVVWLLYMVVRKVQHDPVLRLPGLPAPLLSLLLVCAALLMLHRIYMYISAGDHASEEPFMLSAISGKGHGVPRDHNVAHHARYDQAELQARRDYRPAPEARRKNVIVLVADALRGDHVQAYGYARPTTPFLQQRLADGRLEKFDAVHSSCAESTCSMASLVASRDANRIPNDPFTIMQVLRLHGYKIEMILGGDQTNYYNKRALFGKVDSYFDGSMATGYYMSDDSFVLAKTRELKPWDGKPLYLQFHFLSTHLLGKKLDPYQVFKPSKTYAGHMKGNPYQPFTNHYDNGVLQFDAFVEQILEQLRQKHYLDDALVIITSDHGESLGEKGRMSHANGVYEPVMHIPLLVSGLAPRPSAGGRPFISQADIAPTILRELGMPVPSSWTGVPIQQLQARGTNTELAYFEMYDNAGVFDGRQAGRQWKYWIDRHSKEEFVFDLGRDPQETRNLLLQAPSALMAEWRARVMPDLRR